MLSILIVIGLLNRATIDNQLLASIISQMSLLYHYSFDNNTNGERETFLYVTKALPLKPISDEFAMKRKSTTFN